MMSAAVLADPRGPEYLAPAWVKDPSLLPGATPIELVPGTSMWPAPALILSVLLVLVVLTAAAVVAKRHMRRRDQSTAALALSVGAPIKRHAA